MSARSWPKEFEGFKGVGGVRERSKGEVVKDISVFFFFAQPTLFFSFSFFFLLSSFLFPFFFSASQQALQTSNPIRKIVDCRREPKGYTYTHI